MPIGTLIGFIGLLGATLVLFDRLLNNRWEAEAFAMAVTVALVPVALILLRWMRGHFNRQIDDP